jgi:hypothetical protein
MVDGGEMGPRWWKPIEDAQRQEIDPLQWQPMDSAPTDGTVIMVYAPGVAHGLPDITCMCAYDPSAGFCVDELREPLMWRRLPADYITGPNPSMTLNVREPLPERPQPVIEVGPRRRALRI